MIPHKSRKFRAILDLSYTIKLMQQQIEAINNTTTKNAPQGEMDQVGHVLDQIIYAFVGAEDDDITCWRENGTVTPGTPAAWHTTLWPP